MKIRSNTLKLLKHYHKTKNSEALLRSSSKLQVESPNSIVARAYTARALFMTSKYSQAAEIFESIIIPFPRLKKLYIEYLESIWLSGQRSIYEVQAFRFLEYHFSVRICYRLGSLMIKQKRWRKALKCFLRMRAEEEGNLRESGELKLKATLGKIYYYLGDFRGAIAELDGVKTSTAYYYLGKVYADQSRPGMALQQLEKVEVLARNKSVLSLMRQLQKDLGLVEAEEKTLHMLFRLYTNSERRLKILDRLLWIAEKRDDYNSILQILRHKRELGVHGAPEVKKAAAAYWDQDKYRQATKGYEKLLKISPFDEEALVRLSGYYLQEGNGKRAYQILKSCYLSGKANPGIQLEYAESALLLDKVNEGRDVLLNLIEKGNESPRVNYLLWKIYDNQGKAKAASYYKKLFERARVA